MNTSWRRLLILTLLFVLALFLRVYKMPEQLRLSFDEARDVSVEFDILHRKFTLLGPESTLGNHIIYFGPVNNYFLAPSLWLSHYDPIGPAVFTAVLGAVTVVVTFFISRNMLASAFMAVFPVSVIYNRWAWYPNIIPFWSALCLLALYKKWFFWVGLTLSFSIQQHLTATGLLFAILFIGWKQKFLLSGKVWIWLLLGIIVGFLPIIIFDLRHDFLYLKSTLGILSVGSGSRSFNFHYLLWLLPPTALAFGRFKKIIALPSLVVFLLITVFLIISKKTNWAENPSVIKSITKIIAADQKTTPELNFNVASFVDPDTRASGYRYFLKVSGMNPLSPAEYGVSDHMYVTTYADVNSTINNPTFEINSFGPKRISKTWRYNNINIYRLERN